jgi:hypothetical protein
MRGDDELGCKYAIFLTSYLDQFQHVPDKNLLQLGVKMGFGLFDKDEMQGRAIFI